MSNGHVCCILGVCCPPGSSRQREALATELAKVSGQHQEAVTTPSHVRACADYILDNFDLAPKGSLEQFKLDISTMARRQAKNGE